ncbi:TAP-like protein-domain-containing protein [Armillaria fumosa]|nr:TAP-like protein-domain-containing protein [Armillaria fumosa]
MHAFPGILYLFLQQYYKFSRAWKVPINYSNEDGDKAALAVIKIPAQSDVEYKGAFLTNLGGPGVSGVTFLDAIRPLLDLVIGNQYDIISFDPRGYPSTEEFLGVANSTPRAEFFLSKEEHYRWLASTDQYTVSVNGTSDQIPHLWAASQVIAGLAEATDNGILNYIGTDNVARDMLRISEAAGQEKLQYWGYSYGTAIGATFAAIFPDKIERMVLDGVMDMEGYYIGKLACIFASSVSDLLPSQVIGFATSMIRTRPCNTSLTDARPPVQMHVLSTPPPQKKYPITSILYTSLLTEPVPVVSTSSYGVVDYNVLKTAVLVSLYDPYTLFPVLAQGLASLAAGDGTIIYEMQETTIDPSSYYDNSWEVRIAVPCGDAPNNDTVADLFAYWDRNKDVTSFSDLIIKTISCSGWKFHRDDRFTGPVAGNTSYPILFIGNTAASIIPHVDIYLDPVTPLSAAKNASSAFPGSVVLTRNATGHTSLSSESVCTQDYVRAYFHNGTLPDDGTVCEIESELFPTSSNATLFVEHSVINDIR